ncbi:amino acid exporter [gut metagenome]|uniref:Amino acid exporter n=1 Tax=gut metagenome TaxID=749906 RepID=J9FSA8_9ZZZZ
MGFASIVAGAMLWWMGLTYVINRMKKNFGIRGILWLNRTIGSIVLVASILYATMTIFHLSL